MYLAFDTEVTGIPRKGLSLSSKEQPRIVQFAAIRFRADGVVEDQFVSLVRPDGWVVPDEMVDVHGITTEDCLQSGIPMTQVASRAAELAAGCIATVAHHAAFDHKMVDIEVAQHGFDHPLGIPSLCTMLLSTDVLKIPAWPGKFKYPSLHESCVGILGRPPACQHDALSDAADCMAIFLALNALGVVPSIK